eukprot:scaffold4035_cov132-Isochrysis_galbana.AAC.4
MCGARGRAGTAPGPLPSSRAYTRRWPPMAGDRAGVLGPHGQVACCMDGDSGSTVGTSHCAPRAAPPPICPTRTQSGVVAAVA